MTEQKKIQLMKPNIGKDEIELVKEVFESGYLVEGPKVREFEATVSEYIGVKHAIACTSATTGLELSLRALGVGKGDEVVVPDFTHPATALVVLTVGAKPVLIDVDIHSYNTTAEYIEEAITEKTKAIIPVSIFGNPLDIDPIMEMGERYNIPIIEDAACSLGSEYNNNKIGSIANMTVFSFHPRKIFTTGDGGLLVTNNDEYAELISSLKRFGVGEINGKATFVRWGTNYRMSDILGAVALAQVRRIDRIIENRIEKANVYNRLLLGVGDVVIPKIDKFSKSNYQTYAIMIKNGKRDDILKEMRKRNIEVQIGTFALHLLPVFRDTKSVGDLKNSLFLYHGLLALPLHADLTEDEQCYVVDALKALLIDLT